jgi:hypothetical protein
VQLDAGRLRDLEVFNETELRDIGRGAILALAEQLDALDGALAEGNLPAAAEAAHRARNETQLVGARELSDALGSVEDAARGGRDPLAREAAAAARSLWPSTRKAIERATERPPQ